MQDPPERPKPESQAEQVEASVQVVQPLGHEVQLEAPAAEKEPEVHEAQAAEPPAENWLAEHWVQDPPERPKPESQAEQVEASEQVVQPLGHVVQDEAPAAEKEPEVQAAHAAEPPAENWLAEHWVQEPELRPKPESQAEQVDASEQVVQPLGQEVQLEAPAAENEPEAQDWHPLDPPAENWLVVH